MNFVYNVVSQLDIVFNSTHVSLLLVGSPSSSLNSSSSSSYAGCRTPDIELLQYADVDSLLVAIDTVRQSYLSAAVNVTAGAGNLSDCLRSTVADVLVEAAGGRPYVPHVVVAVTSATLIRSSNNLDSQSLTAAARYVTGSGNHL
jgi:hypothetical protein